MKDLNGYIAGLDKSMNTKEKLFFFKKLNLNKYDFIVDFGCANGAMLKAIDKKLRKNSKTVLVGIDNNPQMKVNAKEFKHKLIHAPSFSYTPLRIMQGKQVLFILSSVLHEVDFLTYTQILNFANAYATTVCIRDMCYQINNKEFEKEEVRAQAFLAERSNIELQEGKFWHDRFAPRLYEYFLKYTYTANWETEKQEEYFSMILPNTLRVLGQNFRKKYEKHYILPFKKKQVRKDFGYELKANTHVKAIFERKK